GDISTGSESDLALRGGKFMLYTINEDDTLAGIRYVSDISDPDNNVNSLIVFSEGISNFRGISADDYYGANYDDNTYVQKKYVDEAIAGAQEQFTTDESLYLDPITNELRANVSDFSEKYTYTGGVQEFVLTSTPTKIIFISVNGQLLEDLLT